MGAAGEAGHHPGARGQSAGGDEAATTRSLNEPLGFAVSSFSHRSVTPSAAPSDGAATSGVIPTSAAPDGSSKGSRSR